MLFDAVVEEGDDVELTLEFAGSGPQVITVEVMSTGPMSGMGMDHDMTDMDKDENEDA